MLFLKLWGGGQFTGLDRRENDILFRDALYGAIGVKRRPVRIDQYAESKNYDLNKNREGLARWMAKHEKDFNEDRITKAQLDKYQKQFDAKNEEYEEEGERIERASR
ncbi:hypothetical protein [Endozoicomonas ascidiicola]|uniref:hypothetical protein n=1 Tax=Endozoicomonas ascidiicola TaxID=1698521 RepID=UPI000AC33A18|nr:hypothetical protein [Endozoicomonas ascidiicola]